MTHQLWVEIPGFLGFLNEANEKNHFQKWYQNDNKIEPICWELIIENLVFNYCVGVWVGWRPRQTFNLNQKMHENLDLRIQPYY